MTLWICFAASLVVTVVLSVGSAAWFDDFSGKFMFLGILAVFALTAAIVFGSMLGSRHFARVSCRNFAATTERQTKFIFYNSFSWDCLTPTANGKWIPTSNLREFGETP